MKTAEELVGGIAVAMAITQMSDESKLLDVFIDNIRAIQADALEAAAKACEPMALTQEPYTRTVEECQVAIRKLKPVMP